MFIANGILFNHASVEYLDPARDRAGALGKGDAMAMAIMIDADVKARQDDLAAGNVRADRR
jgi:hypothetical protein